MCDTPAGDIIASSISTAMKTKRKEGHMPPNAMFLPVIIHCPRKAAAAARNEWPQNSRGESGVGMAHGQFTLHLFQYL
jgi:hypothetical protein